mmetsp:Transcript_1418/g.3802  ORF Transcript_1418/g.3802 Transcript_1418/m.3802 type:complete len:137 (-) Transcript_1418:63-473(-)
MERFFKSHRQAEAVLGSRGLVAFEHALDLQRGTSNTPCMWLSWLAGRWICRLVVAEAPTSNTSARTGSAMWMGGGGGTFWSVDKKRKLITLTFSPVIGGRATEDDGLGPLAHDATPFAVKAADMGATTRKQKRRRT